MEGFRGTLKDQRTMNQANGEQASLLATKSAEANLLVPHSTGASQ